MGRQVDDVRVALVLIGWQSNDNRDFPIIGLFKFIEQDGSAAHGADYGRPHQLAVPLAAAFSCKASWLGYSSVCRSERRSISRRS